MRSKEVRFVAVITVFCSLLIAPGLAQDALSARDFAAEIETALRSAKRAA